MNTGSWIAFRYLIERCSSDKQVTFSRYLSEHDQQELTKVPALKENPFCSLPSLDNRLECIHYSWFLSFLTPLSVLEQRCFLATLNENIAKKLQRYFQIKDPLPNLSPQVKLYFAHTLLSFVTKGESALLSPSFLPQNPLNTLLSLTKNQMQQAADFLGLYDLATEIPHVVKTEQIKKIQQVLSKQQKEELKKLLRKPLSPTFSRLNLDQWDGNETTLKNILHHRGFNRMSKALFGCHPALFWYICHRLDTGRAKIIRRFFTDVKNDSIKEKLINQVIEAIRISREEDE